MVRAVWCLWVVLGACGFPALDVTGKTCSSLDLCPAPWVCTRGICKKSATPVTATPVFARGLFESGSLARQRVPHSLGVAPSALWLWTIGTRATALSDGSVLGFGLSDGVLSRALASTSVGEGSVGEIDDASVVWLDADGTIGGRAVLDSWDPTGFTLRWTVLPVVPVSLHFALVGGEGVAAAVRDLSPEVSVGFAPVVVFAVGSAGTAALNRSSRGAGFSLGVGTAGASWALTEQRTDAAAAPMSTHLQQAGSALLQGTTGFTLSLGNDGFSVSPAPLMRGFAMAISGVAVKAGSAAKVNGTVSTLFAPRLLFAAGTQDSFQTSPRADGIRGSRCARRVLHRTAGRVGIERYQPVPGFRVLHRGRSRQPGDGEGAGHIVRKRLRLGLGAE